MALLLPGAGALGSHQAGVYQALAEADLHPGRVAVIPIGAVNAALTLDLGKVVHDDLKSMET